jgi:NADH-quinone oxidoreductase subunit M
VVAAAALNGIAVLRAYLLLFTGARHASTVSLGIGTRERAAVLTLSVLILGGGLFPQPGVRSRERAAEEILGTRQARPAAEGRPREGDGVLLEPTPGAVGPRARVERAGP